MSLLSEGGPPGAQILCWFSLQTRRWLRRHVKQSVQMFIKECPFSAPSPRGTMVQKFPMHAYSFVSLVSA